jgi:Arc/MetJ family transcription regulator
VERLVPPRFNEPAAAHRRTHHEPALAHNSALYTSYARLVYDACMAKVRTNIEIEDDYVRVIMDRYSVHTKTEAVDLALRHLAGQPMTREEALALRGAHAIGEIPADVAPRGAA